MSLGAYASALLVDFSLIFVGSGPPPPSWPLYPPIDIPLADALFLLHLMGPPDPPPDAPQPFSSAPVGCTHDNGTDFMSQYLMPLASSLPGTVPGLLVHLGGIPLGQWAVPSMGCSLHATSICGLGGTSSVPVGSALCTPVPQDTTSMGPC